MKMYHEMLTFPIEIYSLLISTDNNYFLCLGSRSWYKRGRFEETITAVSLGFGKTRRTQCDPVGQDNDAQAKTCSSSGTTSATAVSKC